MKTDDRRIERALFIGTECENTLAVFDAVRLENFRLDICYVNTAKELLVTCCEFDPALILFDLTAESINIYSQVNDVISIGELPAIVFSPQGISESVKRIAKELGLDVVLIGTGSVRRDAALFAEVLTLVLEYPGVQNYPRIRGNIVTETAWHDPEYERLMSPQAISELLELLGIRKSLAGHKYLVYAIDTQAKLYGEPHPKVLYNHVACEFCTTARAVEKAIRYAIETAWTKGDIYTQHRIFGLSVDESRGKPTNAEFIARLALEFKPGLRYC